MAMPPASYIDHVLTIANRFSIGLQLMADLIPAETAPSPCKTHGASNEKQFRTSNLSLSDLKSQMVRLQYTRHGDTDCRSSSASSITPCSNSSILVARTTTKCRLLCCTRTRPIDIFILQDGKAMGRHRCCKHRHRGRSLKR